MNIPEMSAVAKQHWRQFYPETYDLMKKNGELDSEAEAAADLTQLEMNTLMKGGLSESSAWEAARQLFILADPSKNYNP